MEGHACEGRHISPFLEWTPVPVGTEDVALTVEDPDAPGQTVAHWFFEGSANRTLRPRDLDPEKHFSGCQIPTEGTNDFGNVGHGGPCSPAGDGPHRCFFRLCALDICLDVERGADEPSVREVMPGHVLGETVLVGIYER